MSTPNQNVQFLRQVSLVVANGPQGLDLSALRIKFQIFQEDFESPNHAVIRIYNLSDTTVKQIQGEYTYVVLKAGYQNSAFGIIFAGNIKQIKIGRENAMDTYLDIFAADSDLGYNFGTIGQPFAAGSTIKEQVFALVTAMQKADPSINAPDLNYMPALTGLESVQLIRGKVGFGMARAMMRGIANSIGATWSIQNGNVQLVQLDGYLSGTAVELNALTGMVGIPEQTDVGIRVRSLLNPKLRVGGLLKLTNKDITQTQADDIIAYNNRRQQIHISKIANGTDGLYRMYVIEHVGDTRGHEWYSDIICLAINQDTGKVATKS